MYPGRASTGIRKQQIVNAVIKLITTQGMEGVTIGAIAEEIGLAEGAIYRHFKSKQDILLLVLEDIEQVVMAVLAEATRPGGLAVENLKRTLEGHLGSIAGRRAVSFIVIGQAVGFEGLGLRARVAAMMTRYLEHIQQVLRDGVAERSLRSDLDVEAAAISFLGIVQSSATLWALNDYQPELAERREQMWEIYRRGIVAEDLR